MSRSTSAESLANVFVGALLATAAGLWIYAGTTADPQRVAAVAASVQKSAAASDLVRFELAKTPTPTIWQLSSLRRQADAVIALDFPKSTAGIPAKGKKDLL